MTIQQLSATYVPEEDRVLFRFNTADSQECRLWLTRAVVRELLEQGTRAGLALAGREHPPERARAVAQFRQQAVAESARPTSFVPARRLPLGAEPSLVLRVSLGLGPELGLLELGLRRGQVLTLSLSEHLLAHLRLLLQTIEARAGWGLQPGPALGVRHDPAQGELAPPSAATEGEAQGEGPQAGQGTLPGGPTKLLH